MKVKGYKFSGYDATYRKTLFDVRERGERVLEIIDLDSGTTFLVDFNSAEEPYRRTSKWIKEERKDNCGVSVNFGKAGLFEQLIYEGKKRKINKDGGAE